MKRSIIGIAAIAGLALASSAMAQNTGARLTDGDSLYDVTSAGTAGTIPTTSEPTGTSAQIQGNFRITGGPGTGGLDNVYANYWWYRTSTDTRELSVRQAAGTAVKTLTGTNQVNYGITTTNTSLAFNLGYILTDGNNEGTIRTTLTVTNTSAATVSGINLFNMMDLFLNNADASDHVNGVTVSGGNRTISFDDTAAAAGSITKYALWTGYGATGYGVGDFGGISSQVTDTGIDNFPDVITSNPPAGQDLSGVMQFNIGDLLPGESRTVMVDLLVPAPGSIALLGIGGLIAARRRRS